MSAINSLIKIKFFWNLFEIGFSNHDSVSHRPISELKRLKFAQPADLPVQQAVMVTNLKTAEARSASLSRCRCSAAPTR